jgi:hypothetical protein
MLALVVTVFGVSFLTLGKEGEPNDPSHFKVEFENESIVVLRVRLDPHEKTPMHKVSPRMVVWLTDAHLRDLKARLLQLPESVWA